MQMRSFVIAIVALLNVYGRCSEKRSSDTELSSTPCPPGVDEVDFWLTKADQTILLQKQSSALSFGTATNSYPDITVDTTQRFQAIDGFGYTLTSGSATLINSLTAASRTALLQALFGKEANSINISYLRISIGASDLSASVYTYDDMPPGQTDPTLANFNLA